MARNVYVGVGSVAKHVKNLFVGVGGVARKIKAGYVGINGVARLFYNGGDWWLPSGISSSNVLAHWNFKESNGSFVNPSESGSSSTYSAGTGWNVNFALNHTINVTPVCAVFRYANLGSGSQQFSSKNEYFAARLGTCNYFYNGAWLSETINYPTFCMSFDTTNHKFSYFRGNSTAPASGVIAFDRTYPQIFINGSSIGCTAGSLNAERINNLPIGMGSYLYPIGGSACNCTMIAVAFYNTKLSSTQEAELYRNMISL